MSTKILQIVDAVVKDADTLDGQHASDFAATADVEALESQVSDAQTQITNISGLVGDTSVAQQISDATEEKLAYIDQDVKTTASPTFNVVTANKVIGAVYA